MKYFLLVIAVLLTASSAVPAHSHGGGTDANGCHKETKTGGFHCH
jgi:hypothetical protein